VKIRTSSTWTKRPYEALLCLEIDFKFFERRISGRLGYRLPATGGAAGEIPLSLNLDSKSDSASGHSTVSGGQFLWGRDLLKGNGGVQRFPQAGRKSAGEYKDTRELDGETYKSSRDESRS